MGPTSRPDTGGSDTSKGGEGRDILMGGNGSDLLDSGSGDDAISGDNNYEVAWGYQFAGNDTAYGAP